MHNFDRTQLEADFEDEAFEAEALESGEAFDDDEAFADDVPDQLVPGGLVFSEAEEEAMAAELLNLGDDEEFEEFFLRGLRKAFGRVKRGARRALRKTRGVRRRVRRRLTKRLKSGLKRIARTALTGAGAAAGSFFGGPVGGKIGSSIGSSVGGALGLELEGLSPEDRDFAVARQIVRMTGDAMAEAMGIGEDVDDDEAGDLALRKVIRRHAPSSGGAAGTHSGRWVRRGDQIVLLGA